LGHYQTPGRTRGVDLDPSRNLLILPVSGAGVRAIDASDPSAPKEVGALDTPGDAQDVCIDKDGYYPYYVSVSDGEGGLRIIDILDPSDIYEVEACETIPAMKATFGSEDDLHIEVFLFSAMGEEGLGALRFNKETLELMEVGRCATPSADTSLTPCKQLAYVAGGPWTRGVAAIDVSDPFNPWEMGSCETIAQVNAVHLYGNYAFLAAHDAGLRVIDIMSLEEVGFYDTPGLASGVYVSGNYSSISGNYTPMAGDYAYVADGEEGLRIIDVSDPSNPYQVAAYNTPGYAQGVCVSGDYIYVADGECGVCILRYTGAPAPPVADANGPYTGAVEMDFPRPIESVASGTVVEELSQLRDDVLAKNEAGKKLTNLYSKHSSEIVGILLKDPSLSARSATILGDMMPGIRFLLGDRRGRDMAMTPLRVARIKKLFADIGAQGSDELAQTLSMLSDMLERYKGMRVSQIWREISEK